MKILDTTLRDGEQMPGVVFSLNEKMGLAKRILEFGADFIDLMPAVSESDRKTTEYLSEQNPGRVVASTMMKKDHIDLAKRCGVQRITLFNPVSDIHLDRRLHISREKNLSRSLQFVEYAKEQELTVDFAGEDSTRADLSYLIEFIKKLDVDYFYPCDTLGSLTPFQTYDFIKRLKQETACKLGLHVHNDFGQATANTLAGLEAGAELFSGTFNGIGERAGNTPIEEIVMALRFQYGRALPVKYELLGEICDLIKKCSGSWLQSHKPISGENAFSHESGLHVDGILKYPRNYENFDPRVIGRQRRILYGKHSGVSSLKHLFGDKFTNEQYKTMLGIVKRLSQCEKRSFTEGEVLKYFCYVFKNGK